MSRVLITGANRGLGLEHTRQYAERGWTVHATARDPLGSRELELIREEFPMTVHVHALEVTDADAVDGLASELQGESLDVLLNNAGTFGPMGAPEGMSYQTLDAMDYDIWRHMLEVNLLAPFRVAVAFRSLLESAQRGLLVNMSSGLGSIADNEHGQSHAYRSTKAGLNMLTKGMSVDLPGVIVIAMSPGWCKTDLGGDDAPVDPVDSVREQHALYERLTPEHSGRYLDPRGNEVPW